VQGVLAFGMQAQVQGVLVVWRWFKGRGCTSATPLHSWALAAAGGAVGVGVVAGAGGARGMSPGKVVPGAAYGKGVYPNIVVLLPATAARPTGFSV
jgi:hypothetical protein